MLKLRSKIIVLLVIPLLCIQCELFRSSGEVSVDIERFDQDFYAIDTKDFKNGIELLAAKYPEFYPVFVEGVMAITPDYREIDSYLDILYEFRTHPSMLGLNDTVQKYYPDMETLNKEFEGAFNNYIKHFPNADLPEVVSFVSEFGTKAILYDNGIGISLDMFLGKQYPYYPGMQLPGFIIENLRAGQILPNSMRVWAEDHITPPGADATMLDVIIAEGKKLYFAAQMLPDKPEHSIIEYRPEQHQWCVDSELQIWGFLLENDILYSSKYAEFNRYVSEAPTTYGMPPESPGKTGVWIGWQIVKAYMRAHPKTSMTKLLSELDARTILDGSAYKPER
ncbi:MAG: hypothetical protein GY751_16795 [Bacteroidetes bacterium]|nr:hypothetical protein [Bacteroidota bacterium]